MSVVEVASDLHGLFSLFILYRGNTQAYSNEFVQIFREYESLRKLWNFQSSWIKTPAVSMQGKRSPATHAECFARTDAISRTSETGPRRSSKYQVCAHTAAVRHTSKQSAYRYDARVQLIEISNSSPACDRPSTDRMSRIRRSNPLQNWFSTAATTARRQHN